MTHGLQCTQIAEAEPAILLGGTSAEEGFAFWF